MFWLGEQLPPALRRPRVDPRPWAWTGMKMCEGLEVANFLQLLKPRITAVASDSPMRVGCKAFSTT